jgi:hypothetical protein
MDDVFLLWFRRVFGGARKESNGDLGKDGEGSSLGQVVASSILSSNLTVTSSDESTSSPLVWDGSTYAEDSRKRESPTAADEDLEGVGLEKERFNLDGRSPDLDGRGLSSLILWRPPWFGFVLFVGDNIGWVKGEPDMFCPQVGDSVMELPE